MVSGQFKLQNTLTVKDLYLVKLLTGSLTDLGSVCTYLSFILSDIKIEKRL